MFILTQNLVDLAGSEHASQTNADGARLKEGSHINRSLLTLTTIIRKLSMKSSNLRKQTQIREITWYSSVSMKVHAQQCGGKRSGHIPYRDSKLTRLLQSSLGGNAQTAIICTISPALSHVEQTRNTLSFATSAKEVTNSVKINMKEVARLEAELQSPEPSYLRSILEEKDLKIQQKLHFKDGKGKCRRYYWGRTNVDLLVKSLCVFLFLERMKQFLLIVGRSVASTDPSMLVNEIRKLEQRQKQLGDEANRALEVLLEEVALHQLGNKETAETTARLLSEIKEIQAVRSISEESVTAERANLKDEISRWQTQAEDIKSLERKLENVQKSIDQHPIRSPCSPLNPSRRVMDYETENKAPENNMQLLVMTQWLGVGLIPCMHPFLFPDSDKGKQTNSSQVTLMSATHHTALRLSGDGFPPGLSTGAPLSPIACMGWSQLLGQLGDWNRRSIGLKSTLDLLLIVFKCICEGVFSLQIIVNPDS
nr:kinesin-like protein NACK2 [Malus domestica]